VEHVGYVLYARFVCRREQFAKIPENMANSAQFMGLNGKTNSSDSICKWIICRRNVFKKSETITWFQNKYSTKKQLDIFDR
jgi:hypothetical protein